MSPYLWPDWNWYHETFPNTPSLIMVGDIRDKANRLLPKWGVPDIYGQTEAIGGKFAIVSDRQWDRTTGPELDAVIAHEIGHMLGLSHEGYWGGNLMRANFAGVKGLNALNLNDYQISLLRKSPHLKPVPDPIPLPLFFGI